MTKQEVAAKVAEKTNIGQHQAVKVVETVMEVITEAVCGGNEVTLRRSEEHTSELQSHA